MPLPKEDHYTLADVLTWNEQERIELIDGAPVMMAPPSRAHQKISGELGRQLGNYLDGKKCEVYAALSPSGSLRSPATGPRTLIPWWNPTCPLCVIPTSWTMWAARALLTLSSRFCPPPPSAMTGW